MNRRSFLSLGGLFGVGAGMAASVAAASRPTGAKTMLSCEGAHEPVEEYCGRKTAIAIAHNNDPVRALVPCKKCGALFALPQAPMLKELPPEPPSQRIGFWEYSNGTGAGITAVGLK